MTVLPTLTLTGEDQLLDLPLSNEIRTASVKLPNNVGSTSKLVTQDQVVGNKWSEPEPHHRMICSTAQYIAYIATNVKLNSPIVKITDKEFYKRTVIKDIKGQVVQLMFRNTPTDSSDPDVRLDEVIAILSVEETGGSRMLWLAVYEVCVTDRSELQNTEICKEVLCDNMVLGTAPRLAIHYIPTNESTAVAVALCNIVYLVTLEEEKDPVIKNVELPISNAIVSINLNYVDNSLLMATCSDNGFLIFYNTAEDEILEDPYPLFGDECVTVNWMGFPDDVEGEEKLVWQTLIVSTDTKISIFSLQQWIFSYELHLQIPVDQDMSRSMQYSLDSRGRFLVLSSQHSSFLYVLELSQTLGYDQPDVFCRLFCYPMKSGFFDLAISDIVKQENVIGRYEDSSIKYTIGLLAISNSAMYRCKVVFDTGFLSASTDSGQQFLNISQQEAIRLQSSQPALNSTYPQPSQPGPIPPLPQPSQIHMNLSQPPHIAPVSQSPQHPPIARTPLQSPQHSPIVPPLQSPQHHIIAPPQLPQPSLISLLPQPSLISPLPQHPLPQPPLTQPLLTPESFSQRTPPRYVGLSTDLPKNAPKCADYATTGDEDVDLMPTPLPTPLSTLLPTHAGNEEDLHADEELLSLLASLFIPGADSREVEDFEAHLLSSLSLGVQFVDFYKSETGYESVVHPTILDKVISKHILIKGFNRPGFARDIIREVPALGDDLIDVLMDFTGSLFSSNHNCYLALSHFSHFGEIIRDLYSDFLPDADTSRSMLLRLFEQLVKRKYDVPEEDPELYDKWNAFIGSNLETMIHLIMEKEHDNYGFIIRINDVLEPLGSNFSSFLKRSLQLSDSTNVEENKVRLLTKSGKDFASPESPKEYTNIVSLLEYLDEEDVSCDRACHIARQISETSDTDGRTNLANSVVDNYHSKGWYSDVILELCDSVPELKPLLVERLTEKTRSWPKGLNHPICHNVKLPSPGPLPPGEYTYSSGTSPLSFYIRSTHQLPLINFIQSSLSELLVAPSAANDNNEIPSCDYTAREGDLVACYRGDRSWQRGQVVSVHDQEDIKVLLVDVGSVVETTGACLCTLPLFRGVPAKARCVRVFGVTCPEEHCNEVMEKFQHIMEGEVMTVYPEPNQENTCVRVSAGLSDGKDLAELLHESSIVALTGDNDAWRDRIELPVVTPYTNDSLPTVLDPLQHSIVKLVDAFVSLNKFSRSWDNLEVEIKDVVLLKIRDALGQKSRYTQKPKENGRSDKPATSRVSSDRQSSSSQSSSRAPSDSAPLPTELSGDQQTTKAPSVAVKEPIPTFTSMDIREPKEKVHYIDTSKADNFRQINEGLKKAAKDIESFTKKGHVLDEHKLRSVIEENMVVNKSHDYDLDVKNCASVFFDKAYEIFSESIERFYETEVTGKLKFHLKDMLDKQDNLTFAITDKMKSSIQGNVTSIVKTVTGEVQTALENQFSSDETLTKEIENKLLPSWQKMLDHIYQTFEDSLQQELNHYLSSVSQQVGSNEAENLAQLDLIDRLLDDLEKRLSLARSQNQFVCSKLENSLKTAVSDLYSRYAT